MMISTRGRYALRVLAEMAEHSPDERIPLKDISEKQGISLKYMESIMTLLSKNGFVDGVHGKGGGYKLNRSPAEYKIGDILRLTEGTLAPVACLEKDAKPCERENSCRTLKMWRKLDDMIESYFDSVSIADLIEE